MTDLRVTLRYQDKIYEYNQDFSDEDPAWDAGHTAWYMYTEGNYACDCNRSLFIGRYCDDDFPEMDCGDTIALVELRIDGEVIWPNGETIRERAAMLGLWTP